MGQSTFLSLAQDIRASVARALPQLHKISADSAVQPLAPGKWSAAEVIGHLIDSAANSHHRFVRAQESLMLVFPPYAQEHWVASQSYNERPWAELVDFWACYNHHLAHVVERISDERRSVQCKIGSGEPVTLESLVNDYLAHTRHHLRQVGASVASVDA